MSFEEFVKRATSETDRIAKVIEFPVPTGATAFKVKLWVLSDSETTSAVLDAERWVAEQIKDRPVSEESRQLLLDTEEDRQLLSRALRNAADASMPLASVETLRRVLNKDARAVLMQHYLAWADECSPLRSLGAYSLEEQIARLRNFHEAGALSEWLNSCDFVSLKNTALSLADQLFPLPKRSS